VLAAMGLIQVTFGSCREIHRPISVGRGDPTSGSRYRDTKKLRQYCCRQIRSVIHKRSGAPAAELAPDSGSAVWTVILRPGGRLVVFLETATFHAGLRFRESA
jgi:hypothetical protein